MGFYIFICLLMITDEWTSWPLIISNDWNQQIALKKTSKTKIDIINADVQF